MNLRFQVRVSNVNEAESHFISPSTDIMSDANKQIVRCGQCMRCFQTTVASNTPFLSDVTSSIIARDDETMGACDSC